MTTLSQPGPPPGANGQEGSGNGKRFFRRRTIDDARTIDWHQENWQLQVTDPTNPGVYYWDPDYSDAEDGFNTFYPHDRSRYGIGAWIKFIG